MFCFEDGITCIRKHCVKYVYYFCFGLLMQISLADFSAYLHELQVSCTL